MHIGWMCMTSKLRSMKGFSSIEGRIPYNHQVMFNKLLRLPWWCRTTPYGIKCVYVTLYMSSSATSIYSWWCNSALAPIMGLECMRLLCYHPDRVERFGHSKPWHDYLMVTVEVGLPNAGYRHAQYCCCWAWICTVGLLYLRPACLCWQQ